MVCSVSCLFDIGSPQVCRELAVPLVVGEIADREAIIAQLAHIGYRPADATLAPRTFRVRGQAIEVFPLYEKITFRIEVRSDRVERILVLDPQSGDLLQQRDRVVVYPARLHILPEEWIEAAVVEIQAELDMRLRQLRRQGKRLESQRLEAATSFDIRMLREEGYCPGIEVYCRALNRRLPGAPPDTLLDYFPDDLLVFVDESHVTVQQMRGMHAGSDPRHGGRHPPKQEPSPSARGVQSGAWNNAQDDLQPSAMMR